MTCAHLVFVVKYRRKVIGPAAFALIRKSMQATARALDVALVAIESDRDHLHVMLEHPPQLALGSIVRRLKGAASRMVRKAHLPEVLRCLRGAHFWSPSYFVVSCGGAPLATIKAYVDNQRNPHRRKRQKVERRRPPEKAIRLHPGSELPGFRPSP